MNVSHISRRWSHPQTACICSVPKYAQKECISCCSVAGVHGMWWHAQFVAAVHSNLLVPPLTDCSSYEDLHMGHCHAVWWSVVHTLLASTTICASSTWLFTSLIHRLTLSTEALTVASYTTKHIFRKRQ